jgi:hypothetical protein
VQHSTQHILADVLSVERSEGIQILQQTNSVGAGFGVEEINTSIPHVGDINQDFFSKAHKFSHFVWCQGGYSEQIKYRLFSIKMTKTVIPDDANFHPNLLGSR